MFKSVLKLLTIFALATLCISGVVVVNYNIGQNNIRNNVSTTIESNASIMEDSLTNFINQDNISANITMKITYENNEIILNCFCIVNNTGNFKTEISGNVLYNSKDVHFNFVYIDNFLYASFNNTKIKLKTNEVLSDVSSLCSTAGLDLEFLNSIDINALITMLTNATSIQYENGYLNTISIMGILDLNVFTDENNQIYKVVIPPANIESFTVEGEILFNSTTLQVVCPHNQSEYRDITSIFKILKYFLNTFKGGAFEINGELQTRLQTIPICLNISTSTSFSMLLNTQIYSNNVNVFYKDDIIKVDVNEKSGFVNLLELKKDVATNEDFYALICNTSQMLGLNINAETHDFYTLLMENNENIQGFISLLLKQMDLETAFKMMDGLQTALNSSTISMSDSCLDFILNNFNMSVTFKNEKINQINIYTDLINAQLSVYNSNYVVDFNCDNSINLNNIIETKGLISLLNNTISFFGESFISSSIYIKTNHIDLFLDVFFNRTKQFEFLATGTINKKNISIYSDFNYMYISFDGFRFKINATAVIENLQDIIVLNDIDYYNLTVTILTKLVDNFGFNDVETFFNETLINFKIDKSGNVKHIGNTFTFSLKNEEKLEQLYIAKGNTFLVFNFYEGHSKNTFQSFINNIFKNEDFATIELNNAIDFIYSLITKKSLNGNINITYNNISLTLNYSYNFKQGLYAHTILNDNKLEVFVNNNTIFFNYLNYKYYINLLEMQEMEIFDTVLIKTKQLFPEISEILELLTTTPINTDILFDYVLKNINKLTVQHDTIDFSLYGLTFNIRLSDFISGCVFSNMFSLDFTAHACEESFNCDLSDYSNIRDFAFSTVDFNFLISELGVYIENKIFKGSITSSLYGQKINLNYAFTLKDNSINYLHIFGKFNNMPIKIYYDLRISNFIYIEINRLKLCYNRQNISDLLNIFASLTEIDEQLFQKFLNFNVEKFSLGFLKEVMKSYLLTFGENFPPINLNLLLNAFNITNNVLYFSLFDNNLTVNYYFASSCFSLKIKPQDDFYINMDMFLSDKTTEMQASIDAVTQSFLEDISLNTYIDVSNMSKLVLTVLKSLNSSIFNLYGKINIDFLNISLINLDIYIKIAFEKESIIHNHYTFKFSILLDNLPISALIQQNINHLTYINHRTKIWLENGCLKYLRTADKLSGLKIFSTNFYSYKGETEVLSFGSLSVDALSNSENLSNLIQNLTGINNSIKTALKVFLKFNEIDVVDFENLLYDFSFKNNTYYLRLNGASLLKNKLFNEMNFELLEKNNVLKKLNLKLTIAGAININILDAYFVSLFTNKIVNNRGELVSVANFL